MPFRHAPATSTRLLPEALPGGAPLDNVGTARPLVRRDQRNFDAPSPRRAPRGCPLRQCWDNTSSPLRRLCSQHCQRRHPAEGEKKEARTRRCRRPASRIGYLTPEVSSARWSAGEWSQMERIPSHPIRGAPRDSTAIHAVNCFRIRPSWATDATCRPPRSNTAPRVNPRAFEADGLSIAYSSQSSTR
jgi:hypothetical protein